MKKVFQYILTVITLLAGIAAIVEMYFQVHDRKPELEIKSLSTDKLTGLPTIEELSAVYLFKGDTVESLWKLHYLISNIGDEIIIGEGNKKNIIKNDIKFTLNPGFKILEVKSENPDDFVTALIDNCIHLKFLQWKPQENIELVVYAEQKIDNKEPSLTTNEREIINGQVSYSTVLSKVDEKKSLFERLPKGFQSILWWFSVVFLVFLMFVMPIVWFGEFVKYLKYKKWKRKDFFHYKDWVDELVVKERLDSYKNPQDLPNKFWVEYPYVKPIFPDNDFGNLNIGVFFLFFFSAICLLLLIEI